MPNACVMLRAMTAGYVESPGRLFSIYFLVLIGLLISHRTIGQVTVLVNKVPDNTPHTDTLFLTGNFNDWNPHDLRYAFTRHRNGFKVIVPEEVHSFEFKVTRGSWSSVEGDLNGKKIANRVLTTNGEPTGVFEIQILSWEDLANLYTWNIVIDEVPPNTPFDAPVFVSGSFNGWKENDPEYRMAKLDNGQYAIRIRKDAGDTINYKFHRGNWASVECRENGRPRYNRVSHWAESGGTTIHATIEGWEDLTIGTSSGYSMMLIVAVLQCIALFLVLLSVKNANRGLRRLLVAMLLLGAIALASRIATYDRGLFDLQPKLLLVTDLIWFLYPVLFLGLIDRLNEASSMRQRVVLYIPVICLFLFYLPLVIQDKREFVLDSLDGQFNLLFNAVSVVASVFCACIIYLAYRSSRRQMPGERAFIVRALVGYHGIVVCMWILSHGIFVADRLLSADLRLMHETMVDIAWMAFALMPYVYTFVFVRNPALLGTGPGEQAIPAKTGHERKELEVLKTSLTEIMRSQKPHLNSGLCLQDLADLMKVSVHTLSWVINDGYNKNFFDFINEYRIADFKSMITSDQYRNYTFLALAMEVGFSSKTTFNRAFKKCTGKTPREYFVHVQESQLESIS